METPTGLKGFAKGLVSGKDQIIILEGETPAITAFLKAKSNEKKSAKSFLGTIDTSTLQQKLLSHFKRLFAEVIKLSISQLDEDESFENYGINSILITQLNEKLVNIFGEIPKTLFFEHNSLKSLSNYFVSGYPEVCVRWMGLSGEKSTQIENPLTQLNAREKKQIRRFDRVMDRCHDPVAIIGINGRYAQSKNLEEFWENLQSGKNCIGEIPPERWSLEGFFIPNLQEAIAQGKSYSKWGGFLEGFNEFDPLFFNISPREALNIDPQERLFLQSSWEALEDAGYTREQLGKNYNHRIGVFAGITKTGFELYGPELWKTGEGLFPHTSFSSTANRVSYVLDLHGPSMPIDTMCSASLTAIHEACEHLRRGECEMAIAGGVNLYLHPSSYIGLCNQNMLSIDGECRSFGIDGNGFVPGEGVGTVVLKPLSLAIRDGDHIYGVVRGSSVNHGGKTNGYTVPNPTVQGDLIRQALKKAKINARCVSYIEAHGTGTELGDPIEVRGLTKAFESDTTDTGFCALGSAKSNIGHCESAAGIAGVTKVLLQMQHRKIVPSLHSEILNPNIAFEKTPFVVNQKLREWDRPIIDGKEYPRIAGISSFGAGGSNAHVIIEEYIPQGNIANANTQANPALIVISAKNRDRLRVYVQKLLAFIQDTHNQEQKLSLEAVAYTLQVGREAMEERLAIIANSTKDLIEKLNKYLSGEEVIEDLYVGQIKKNKEMISSLETDEILSNAVEVWVAKKNYSKLLEFWTKGLNIDWAKLYGEQKPKKISLPTYPFAKEKYWIEKTGTNSKIRTQGFLHPLVQQNTSTLSGQKFSSTFTGEEFFLREHLVNSQKVLPGVAYLEMAREAVRMAWDDPMVNIELKDVVWSRPIIIETEPKRVHIELYPEENGNISYEIYTKESDHEIIVHSQGVAIIGSIRDERSIPVLDIKALKLTHNHKELTSEQCYEDFDCMGIHYGPAHRGLEKIYIGEDSILAKLTLPASVHLGEFELHPSLMDSALQASIGMKLGGNTSLEKPMLPFALHSLKFFSPCTSKMWAIIHRSEELVSDAIQKLDIELYDEEGRICVMMNGYSSRALKGKLGSESPSALSNRLITIVPTWEAIAIDSAPHMADPSPKVVIIGGSNIKQESLQSKFPHSRCLKIEPKDSLEGIAQIIGTEPMDHLIWIGPEPSFHSIMSDEMIKAQNDGVLFVFKLIKALLVLGYGIKPLNLTILTFNSQSMRKNDRIDPTHAGLHGLIGSLAKEYSNWKIRLLDLESETKLQLQTLFALPSNSEGNALLHHNGEWFKQTLIPISSPSLSTLAEDNTTYRQGGVYVIIGGAGGIGEVWTRWIIEHYQAQVIWIGRREKNAAIQTSIDSFGGDAPRPEYLQADAADLDNLQRAYEEIKSKYSQINGVIHSAIVLSDASIANMTETQLRNSLSAKIDISVRIAQVFGKEALDFVLFFSSMQSFIKAPGQSNYAAGCVFKDAFAKALSQAIPCKVKVMNWGYWGSVGVVASSFYNDLMNKAGMGSIEPDEGIEAVKILMRSSVDQLGVIKIINPSAKIEGISIEEQITDYPKVIPSVIEQVTELLEPVFF